MACKDIVNELYKKFIIEAEHASIEDYFTAWHNVEMAFMEEATTSNKYEVWVKFTSKKIREGAVRLNRNL